MDPSQNQQQAQQQPGRPVYDTSHGGHYGKLHGTRPPSYATTQVLTVRPSFQVPVQRFVDPYPSRKSLFCATCRVEINFTNFCAWFPSSHNKVMRRQSCTRDHGRMSTKGLTGNTRTFSLPTGNRPSTTSRAIPTTTNCISCLSHG